MNRVVIKCFAHHVHPVDTWKLIMYNIYIILLNENKDKKDYNFTLKYASVYLDDCISKYANCDYHPVVGWRVILTSLYISVLSEIFLSTFPI